MTDEPRRERAQPTTLDERVEIKEEAPLGMGQNEGDREEHREKLEEFKSDLKDESEAKAQDPTLGEPRKPGDHAGSEDDSDDGGGTPDGTPPSGTVEEVKAWVGNDPERAQQALDAEYAGQNRSSLITHLEGVVNG